MGEAGVGRRQRAGEASAGVTASEGWGGVAAAAGTCGSAWERRRRAWAPGWRRPASLRPASAGVAAAGGVRESPRRGSDGWGRRPRLVASEAAGRAWRWRRRAPVGYVARILLRGRVSVSDTYRIPILVGYSTSLIDRICSYFLSSVFPFMIFIRIINVDKYIFNISV